MKQERKKNSPFVPVPNSGTSVPAMAVDIDDILHDLEEAKGFAAMSPAGRENIAFALDALPERFETLASQRDDLIKTLERMADLVESRMVIIDTLTNALEPLARAIPTEILERYDDETPVYIQWPGKSEKKAIPVSHLNVGHFRAAALAAKEQI